MPSWDHLVVENQGEHVTAAYWLLVGMYLIKCCTFYISGTLDFKVYGYSVIFEYRVYSGQT